LNAYSNKIFFPEKLTHPPPPNFFPFITPEKKNIFGSPPTQVFFKKNTLPGAQRKKGLKI